MMMMKSQTLPLILTQDDCQIEGAITATTGEIDGIGSSNKWYCSDYVDVHKYKRANITIRVPGSTVGIALYDDNYDYVWGFPYSKLKDLEGPLEFPQNVSYYYIRITASKKQPDYLTTVTLTR